MRASNRTASQPAPRIQASSLTYRELLPTTNSTALEEDLHRGRGMPCQASAPPLHRHLPALECQCLRHCLDSPTSLHPLLEPCPDSAPLHLHRRLQCPVPHPTQPIHQLVFLHRLLRRCQDRSVVQASFHTQTNPLLLQASRWVLRGPRRNSRRYIGRRSTHRKSPSGRRMRQPSMTAKRSTVNSHEKASSTKSRSCSWPRRSR